MKPEPARDARRITGTQWRLVGLIAALAVGRVAYDLLVRHRLQETAALFIGLPAVLAVVFALTLRARGATGTILKGIIGCMIRLPLVCSLLQLIIDATGGGPRVITRRVAGNQ